MIKKLKAIRSYLSKGSFGSKRKSEPSETILSCKGKSCEEAMPSSSERHSKAFGPLGFQASAFIY